MPLDPAHTAVLTLDIQHGILGIAPAAESILPAAALVAQHARDAGYHLIHVGLGFEPGYPEIDSNNARFTLIKERGTFVKGTESAAILPAVYREGELVVHKHRVSAFAGNALPMILAARGISHLVLLGVSTSGIVLSTVRAAADLDFQLTVIKDACFDADAEVHRVLTEKVFARQASVITAQEFRAGAA